MVVAVLLPGLLSAAALTSGGGVLAPASSEPTVPNAEVRRRLDELRQWAEAVGDDIAGVERLMALPQLNFTLNAAVNLDENGERLSEQKFRAHEDGVYVVHNKQTADSRRDLAERWTSKPLLGNVSAWDLLKLLHFTVDNTDGHLMYTSQFIHCLQVYNMAKVDSLHDERYKLDPQYRDDMLIGSLLHDMGKSLSLFGEADGNVDCMNRVTEFSSEGLDGVDFQYNHDRFGHDKLRLNVLGGRLALPQRVLDVANFHSLREMGTLQVPVHLGGTRRAKGLLYLVDGDVVTSQETSNFRMHVTKEDDLRRAAFVQHFGGYDYHSKDRTNTIPIVNVTEIKELLQKYTRGADLEW